MKFYNNNNPKYLDPSYKTNQDFVCGGGWGGGGGGGGGEK